MAKENKIENQIDEKTTKKEVKSSSAKKPRINSSSKKSEAPKDELRKRPVLLQKLKNCQVKLMRILIGMN